MRYSLLVILILTIPASLQPSYGVSLYSPSLSSGADMSQTVRIAVNTASSWGPGRYSRVEIEIHGARNLGPCRLSHTFPPGFDAVAEDAGDGDFYYTGSSVNVVWNELSSAKVIRVSYLVKPPDDADGIVEQLAELYYITDENRRMVVAAPSAGIRAEGTGGLLPAEVTALGRLLQPGGRLSTEKSPQPDLRTQEKDRESDREESAGVAEDLIYRVQVSASSTLIGEEELKQRLKISAVVPVTVVEVDADGGMIYRYQLGQCVTKYCAEELLENIKKDGVEGAFIVAYYRGEQVTIEEAGTIIRR